MNIILAAYCQRFARFSLAAVEYMAPLVEAARALLTSAVYHLGTVALLTPDESFGRMAQGAWLRDRLMLIGTTRAEIDHSTALGIEAARKRSRPPVPSGKRWVPPIG